MHIWYKNKKSPDIYRRDFLFNMIKILVTTYVSANTHNREVEV